MVSFKLLSALLGLFWMSSCFAWIPAANVGMTRPQTDCFMTKKWEDESMMLSRRDVLAGLSAAAVFGVSTPAFAADKDEPIYYPAAEVQKAFDAIRYELEDPNGGVATLQSLVDKVDYDALFEFTKTYDLEFRKAKMSQAKKKYKMGGDLPTQLCNNVTFDLIGMNKSCRKGQENIELTQKYLTELKTDVAKFLELQSSILVEQS